MRTKIGKKILEIVKKEEAAAKKMIDDDEMERINQMDLGEMPQFEDPLKEIGISEENKTPDDLQEQFKKKENKSKLLMALEQTIEAEKQVDEPEEASPGTK